MDMREALKMAGVKVEEQKVKFNSLEEIKFPFDEDGILGWYSSFKKFGHYYSDSYEEGCLKCFNENLNSLREVQRSGLESLFILDTNDPLYKWVLENYGKLKTTGGDWLQSSCIFYLKYNVTYGKFHVVPKNGMFNHLQNSGLRNIALKHRDEIRELTGFEVNNLYHFLHTVVSYEMEGEDAVKLLQILLYFTDFIPVVFDLDVRPVPVYTGYRRTENEYLGANILKNEDFMKSLQQWVAQGGKINPKVWYILGKTKEGFVYLKRDLVKSPKAQNNDKKD